MPLFLLLLLVEILFVVHAVKTGRASPWAFIILFAPVVGVVAYIVAVLIPEWMGGRQGQRAQRSFAKAFNPEKRYREAQRRGRDRRHDREPCGAGAGVRP
jgi:hypothetical protein